nr:TetR/AcrR family transcriptional regulator [Rhizobium sp. L1K21]
MEAALGLVGEKGIAALTMREIATVSGMPLASVYQYFPNKSAVIAMLYSRYAEETRNHVARELVGLNSVHDILPAAFAVIDDYYERFSNTPAVQDLLNAVQADKALQNMDIEATRKQAALFIESTHEFISKDKLEAYGRAVHLLFFLAGGTVRLAMMVEPEEGKRFIEDYKNLVRAQLAPFGG